METTRETDLSAVVKRYGILVDVCKTRAMLMVSMISGARAAHETRRVSIKLEDPIVQAPFGEWINTARLGHSGSAGRVGGAL